jgi:hypothetical protein
MISKQVKKGNWKSFKLCWRDPNISHLLFADDMLFICGS